MIRTCRHRPTAIAFAALLAACGGGSSSGSRQPDIPSPPSAPTVTLSAPASEVLAGSGAVKLSASVSSADAVTWQLGAGAPGTLAGSGASATYTPPATVSANTQVLVTATAGGTSKTVQLTVYPQPGAPRLEWLAGSLAGRGMVDGAGTQARLEYIRAAAAGSGGALFVSDSAGAAGERNALRRIGADCRVTTLLDTPAGHVDGPAGTARIGIVVALQPEADGSVWFIDLGTDDSQTQLRVLGADQSVRTVPTGGALWHPVAMVRGKDGMLYVADDGRILRIAADGATTVFAGAAAAIDPVDGSGADARFTFLRDLTVDSAGNLYAVEVVALRKITPDATVTTVFSNMAPAQPRRDYSAVTVQADGTLLLRGPSGVEQIAAGGRLTTVLAHTDPQLFIGMAPLPMQRLLRATSGGKLLFVDAAEVQELKNGALAPCTGMDYETPTAFNDGAQSEARFSYPNQVATDRAGNIYVLENRTPANSPVLGVTGLYVRKIGTDGRTSTLVSEPSFNRPAGMAADAGGNLYFVEASRVLSRPFPARGGAVWKRAPDGTLSVLAGSSFRDNTSIAPDIVDGQGGNARFGSPGLAGMDSDGNLYVQDQNSASQTVYRKVTPGGAVTTIPQLPPGLGLAPDGFRYAVDNQAIYRVADDGSRAVVAGRAGQRGTMLGDLPGGFDDPHIAPAGPNSFIVTSGNAVLRLVTGAK